MMDPEDLQSNLLALRKLYGLLIKDGRGVQITGSENLDKNTKLLLKNLLNGAAEKAFEVHAKILGAQFTTSYSPWSTPFDQPRDWLNPSQPFLLRNASTKDQNSQKDDMTSESEVRMKRCRICQKPKVKLLTREISIPDSECLTQTHKRSWEFRNDPSGIRASTCSSNSPLTENFVKALALCDQDENEQISREASGKIQQIESRILALRISSKQTNPYESGSISKTLSQTGNFAVGRSDPVSGTSPTTWNPRDTAHQWHDQTASHIEKLTHQAPEKVSPKKSEILNQITNQRETYDLFQSVGDEKDRPLPQKLSTPIKNKGSSVQKKTVKKKAVKHGKTHKDQTNPYKQQIRQRPKRVSDSSVSSSSWSTQSQSQSQDQSPSEEQEPSTSYSESEGSSLSDPTYSSEKEVDSQSSGGKSPSVSSSYESSVSFPEKVPEKGYRRVSHKETNTKQVSRLRKLKDKLAIIFHHHHHHHHHHNDDNNLKRSQSKHVRKSFEAYGEEVVNKNLKKSMVQKVAKNNKKGHFQALVGGFMKTKKLKLPKGGIKRMPIRLKGKHDGGKTGKKMAWWQMLRRQRRIKRLQKLRGKLDTRSTK